MRTSVHVMCMILLAGCHAAPALNGDAMLPEPAPDGGAIDASVPSDPGGDATDAGVDAPPPSLAVLCGGSEPATADDWESCYHRRWCEWEVGCVQLNAYRSVQECISESDKVELGLFTVMSRTNERAVAQGRASINASVFTQCLLDTDATRCDTAASSASCTTRYTGTIEDGGDCYADVECASPGATCEARSDCGAACCLGTCHPRLQEGESCLNDRCAPGLVCNGTCKSGNVGTPCFNFLDCDEDAWCDHGTCTADLKLGDRCTSEAQCGGDTRCLGISITDPTPGTCLRSSRPGDPCRSFCFGNLYCDASEICRELPGLHEPCSPLTLCSGNDTFCSNGQCVPRGDVGASCSSDEPCLPGLFCDSDPSKQPTCMAQKAAGQSCTDASQCESYLCSTEVPRMCLTWSDSCPAPAHSN